MNEKSGLDIQSQVDAVFSFQRDISKSENRQKLLDYLTNSFDHYVSSVVKSSDSQHSFYTAPRLAQNPHRNEYQEENSSLSSDEFDDKHVVHSESRKSKFKTGNFNLKENWTESTIYYFFYFVSFFLVFT